MQQLGNKNFFKYKYKFFNYIEEVLFYLEMFKL